MSDACDPTAVRLEATSACQLRCPSCPTAAGLTKAVLGRGFLKVEDFRAFLDANPQVGHVELSNYGEMFLHPDLPGLLECAYRRRVRLTADNGINLNHAREGALEALVRFRLASMTVSIDGPSAGTYAAYRVGGDFARVIENIREVNRFKEQYASRFPCLTWQFIVFGHNEHEIPLALEMAAGLGMDFHLKLAWGDFPPVRDRPAVRKATGLGAATREEFRERSGSDYMDGLCGQLWDLPQINWDGKVLGCGRNFWGDFGGNAFGGGLGAAVNGERMRYAREMLQGRSPPRQDVPCSTCEIYLDRQRSGRWVRREGEAVVERAVEPEGGSAGGPPARSIHLTQVTYDMHTTSPPTPRSSFTTARV